MKKFLPYILILTIIVQLFAPFSVAPGTKNNLEIKNNKIEAANEECKFIAATYNPFTTITENKLNETTLQIATSGCVGKFFKGYIRKDSMLGGVPMLRIDTQEIITSDFSLRIKVGEQYCGSDSCESTLDLYLLELDGNGQTNELDRYVSTEEPADRDYLDFKCNNNACDQSLLWEVLSSEGLYQSTSWSINPSVTKNSLTVSGLGPVQASSSTSNNNYLVGETLTVSLFKSDNTLVEAKTYNIRDELLEEGSITYTTTFNNLLPQTGYNIKLLTSRSEEYLLNNIFTLDENGNIYIPLPEDPSNRGTSQNKNSPSGLPACSLIPFFGEGTVIGCVAQVFYYVLFVPTSYVFALSGTFFDFTFNYSINDKSYRTPFVVEGWGIVRDFCNMFFIFVLLYIAFGTILGLHSVKTKEMIINVVIIGLLINFSLFATQIIVDASNILARVFYNSDTIRITQGTSAANGVTNVTPKLKIGPNGEIPLSAAIVNKINPQNLIINGTDALKIEDKGEQTQTDENKEDLSTGSFILIILLAVAVNIVGIITFLSVGLIFVSRVIGLWLAMIVSPLVFFSYTVPALQDMEMVGWKKWWPETIKLAFLAPIFIFFMYLIIAFLEKGLSLVKANETTDGMTFVISIIVPFVFIMILLIKAKDIAKDMSGKIGQSITNGVATVGAMALGGAALGTGALLRKGIGSSMAAMSRSDSAKHFDNAKIAHNQALEDWEKRGGAASGITKPVFVAPKHGDTLIDASGNPIKNKWTGKEKKYNSFVANIGNKLNEKQKKVGDIDHARHVYDEKAKAAGVVDKTTGEVLSYEKWTYEDEKKVEKNFKQTESSKTESEVRRGFGSKGVIALTDINGNTLKDSSGRDIVGEEDFKSAKRNEVKDSMIGANSNSPQRAQAIADGIADNQGNLTKLGEEKLRNELKMKLDAAVKVAVDAKLNKDFNHIKEEANTKVNPITRGVAGINTTSFDIRKLSDLKSDKRESGLFSKVPIALISGIATGVRAGMKNVGLSNGGIKVEGNFMKDLGSVISDSLKGIKFNVDLSHVGEHKSSADPHGGGGGHH